MALGGEVDNAVNLVFADYAAHLIDVGDVGAHKGVVGLGLDVAEVGKVAGVGELVEADDAALGIFVDEEAHNMVADEPGATRYKYVFVIH